MFSHPPTVCLCESWLSTIEKLRFRAEATQEWLEELGFSGPSRVCRAPELLGEMSPPSWGLGGSQDLQPPPPFPLPAVREVGRTAHLVTGDGPVGLQPWWSLKWDSEAFPVFESLVKFERPDLSIRDKSLHLITPASSGIQKIPACAPSLVHSRQRPCCFSLQGQSPLQPLARPSWVSDPKTAASWWGKPEVPGINHRDHV